MLGFLRKAKEPVTVNLTARVWGCDYQFTPVEGGKKGTMHGWSPKRFTEGDYLLLKNGDGTTRYQVVKVRWCDDPRDMFFADVVFAPRSKEEK